MLQLDEIDVPTPHAGQVRVDVTAAGINFADTERRRGLYLSGTLPVTTGFEGAGVVSAAEDASWLGRRVAFLSEGSVADHCLASTSRLISLPNEVSDLVGAAFPIQALTAWHVLHTAAQVKPGEHVGVTAAAGGVGLLAVQLARAHGAKVTGFVSTEQKRALALQRGAHDVRLGLTTTGDEFDVLLDSLGRDAAEFGFQALKPFGRWVQFGTSSGAAPPLDTGRLLEKSLTLGGWWLRTPHAADVWQRSIDEVLAALVERRLQLDITTVALHEVADAHRRLESRQSVGKLVVRL